MERLPSQWGPGLLAISLLIAARSFSGSAR